jgi:hypothetical protein
MTAHITYARPTVRGPKLLLTAAVAVTLAISMLTMGGPSANAAAPAPISLGAAGDFAILSAANAHGGAVTCVNTPNPATINGNIGSSGVITPDGCTINGSQTVVGAAVVSAFDDAYAKLALVPCNRTILTEAFTGPATLTVGSGVICFPNAVTFTDTTLTLTGSGPWIFKVGSGTAGSGALEVTNLHMVMPLGANPCDVTWWIRAAATMTTSSASGTQFFGTVLAGAAITVTGAAVGTFNGRALAKAAVSITGGTFTACTGGTISGGGGNGRAKCNQGVGNGPEGCDPGNSNQGDPSRSNDENGGTPGDPGRQGGNGK